MIDLCFNITNKDNFYELIFNPVSRKIPTNAWFDEIINCVQLIKKSTNKEIIVSNSGGIDSEAICWALLECNIPFRVLTVLRTDQSNLYDVEYSFNFCKKTGVECITELLDLNDFIQNKIPTYIAQGYKSKRVFRYVELFYLETISNLGGCAVLGSGEPTLITDHDDVIKLFFDTSLQSTVEWCNNQNELHFPHFYYMTPELLASYINHEIVTSLIDKPHLFKRYDGKNNRHLLKAMVFNHHFKNLDLRIKKTGYETVQEQICETEKYLSNIFPEITYIGKSIIETKLELGIH